ncbi:MAG TPA: acylneuraminate cytidylyltransferase family protein [Chitinophagaceae bacterium]|nr:acylneuraminate cytidylyltransferase family protein [Chitinophagaceae bacterium]
MEPLFIIPARGGSKGIPGKNIKPLAGIPLLHYSISYARQFAGDDHICLTTDSETIIRSAREIGLEVPFIRPAQLATDHTGSYPVIRHALQNFPKNHRQFDPIVLLQPTSPFRLKKHLEEALSLYEPGVDMVASVMESPANPYFNLYEEDPEGSLRISKGEGPYASRQSAPRVYQFNGSLYLINPASLGAHDSFSQFRMVRKFVMDRTFSVDLDTPEDWKFAEWLATTRFKELPENLPSRG